MCKTKLQKKDIPFVFTKNSPHCYSFPHFAKSRCKLSQINSKQLQTGIWEALSHTPRGSFSFWSKSMKKSQIQGDGLKKQINPLNLTYL